MKNYSFFMQKPLLGGGKTPLKVLKFQRLLCCAKGKFGI